MKNNNEINNFKQKIANYYDFNSEYNSLIENTRDDVKKLCLRRLRRFLLLLNDEFNEDIALRCHDYLSDYFSDKIIDSCLNDFKEFRNKYYGEQYFGKNFERFAQLIKESDSLDSKELWVGNQILPSKHVDILASRQLYSIVKFIDEHRDEINETRLIEEVKNQYWIDDVSFIQALIGLYDAADVRERELDDVEVNIELVSEDDNGSAAEIDDNDILII